MDEPTPEDVAVMKAFLERQDKARSELEAQSYDGVRGLPPRWVPEPIIERFRELRNRLIEEDRWAPEQLVDKLDTYGSDEWVFGRRCPAGTQIDPLAFLDDIGFLAHLRYAASLGPDEGLRLLAGKDAYLGYRQRKGSKSGRKDALRELMEATYDQLRKANGDEEPTWRNVLAALPDQDSADELKRTIQEIDDEAEKISWLDRRDRQQETSFATFRDRLTEIRKARR